MTRLMVVGVDPGRTTGVAALIIDNRTITGHVAVQIHGPEGVEIILEGLLDRAGRDDADLLLATEQFVVNARAARARHAGGRNARDLIGALQSFARRNRIDSFARPAAMVKPWATDRRLDAVGLLEPTRGMDHARDALRHALYAAVSIGVLADPLSSRGIG